MLVPVRRAGLRALLSHGQWGHEKARALQMLEFMTSAESPARLRSAVLRAAQALELAAVMMAQPELVLLDEPAGGSTRCCSSGSPNTSGSSMGRA